MGLTELDLEDISKYLHPKVVEAFVKRGFKAPTEVQKKAIPYIARGENVLVIAPTGTGKTEAVLLPLLSKLLYEGIGDGIRILYITPLRALNRDLLDRILWWANELGFKVAVRHGDTEQKERVRQSKEPPHMLITTPETLQAILSGRRLREHLKHVRYVIVDEIHELAEDKRGVQLSLALERLRYIVGSDLQVVGLSATVGSPEEVAKFLAGVGRKCRVVKVDIMKRIDLNVINPKPTDQDFKLAEKLYVHPEVAAKLRFVRDLLNKNRSILVFTNTRATAEVLTSRFKVWNPEIPLGIHHGSLSKISRENAEKSLKFGDLKGLVCTSSLELGIDIGRIELVVQYGSPRQAIRLVQRVGRSGHKVSEVSKGVILTVDPDDILESIVIARRAKNGLLEPIRIPQKPLDVLCHQIAALFQIKRRWRIEEIYEIYSRAYPYKDLTIDELIEVLRYMHERYPRLAWVSFEDGVVLKPRRTRPLYEYFFENLSMIPDEKQYVVINAQDNTPIGILDEAFVAEYGEIGIKFVFRGSLWRIEDITQDKIYVKPIEDPTGAIPSWVGEEIPVPFEVAQEVGKLKRRIEEEIKSGALPEQIATEISKNYFISERDMLDAIKPIIDQVALGYPVPTDKRVLIEILEDFIVVHTHLGTLANRALARLLSDKLASLVGLSIGVQQDAYTIILQIPYIDRYYDDIVKCLHEVLKKEYDLYQQIVKSVVRFGLFRRRLIHVARRFGALRKNIDIRSSEIRRITKMLHDTIVFKEALNEFMTKDLDLASLEIFLNDIRNNRREIVLLKLNSPTPLTSLTLTKLSRKLELIPPERMDKIVLESAKVRLLEEVRVFVCLECGQWYQIGRIREFMNRLKCGLCGSEEIGVVACRENEIHSIIAKKWKNLSKKERRIVNRLRKSRYLIKKYGLPALIAMGGRDLSMSDIERIASEFKEINDDFFRAVIEAERRRLERIRW